MGVVHPTDYYRLAINTRLLYQSIDNRLLYYMYVHVAYRRWYKSLCTPSAPGLVTALVWISGSARTVPPPHAVVPFGDRANMDD